MKIMRYLCCLILILSNIEVQGGSFSIDNLLNYLQETGYWDIILGIKNSFGDDIAIDVCEELVQSIGCVEVVRIYMTKDPGGSGGGGNHVAPYINIDIISEILEYFEKKHNVIEGVIRELIELILNYYYILIENMDNKENIISFIENTFFKKKKIRKDLEILPGFLHK